MPVHLLAEVAAEQRAGEGAGVDAHVEDREAGVAAVVFGGVELAHHGADVGLQHAGADRHQDQAGEENRHLEHAAETRDHRQAEGEVAGGEGDAAPEHRVALADQPVGDPAAGQRHQVDGGGIEPVDGPAGGVGKAEAAVLRLGHQEKQQQGPHAVVAEALPHFREEKRGEAARMSEPLGFGLVRAHAGLLSIDGRVF